MEQKELYLNRGGLKQLSAVLNRIFKKTWHGTRTEWEALTDSERAKWKQAEIYDEGENIGEGVTVISDRVQKGDMNPITSNAVATMLPVGVIEAYIGATAPKNWLICDGSTFNKDVYPELYEVLGSETLPDLRESALVGAGQRATGVADHDVYKVGQFKDDQVQNHKHYRYSNDTNGWNRGVELGDNFTFMQFSSEYENGGPVGHINNDPAYRKGTTTHGKQTGVNWIIYAGIKEA